MNTKNSINKQAVAVFSRHVTLTGLGGFSIKLPLAWAQAQHIKKGSKVRISVEPNGGLFIEHEGDA